MKILITGADGQLGRALNKELKDGDHKIYNADFIADGQFNGLSLDITNRENVLQTVERLLPDLIINCAAFNAVDQCESFMDTASLVNAEGPGYLAKAAELAGAVMVHISTDYVFDGKGKKPYVETDEAHPASEYGKSKLKGEQRVIANCSRYFLIRTAWMYGDGKNFVKTMLRLASAGGQVKVVNDQMGSPTSAAELARMIHFLIRSNQYGIYHGVCSGIASWYEFALEIFRLSGIDVSVIPITTAEYKTPAVRPAYSVLDNHKLKSLGFRPLAWQEALKEYITGNLPDSL